MIDAVITLISETMTRDENGVRRPTEAPRDVLCQLESVTRAEFFSGGRNGLNPEYVFYVFRGDYQNESIVEYNGQRYGVYRAYITDGDYIELYAERKGGMNGTS